MENENKKLLCEHVEEIDECIICYLESEIEDLKKETKFLTILFIILLISISIFISLLLTF